MAITYSKMLELGVKLPDFELINTINNQKFNSNSLSSNRAKVIMFICNHCPFVVHYHKKIKEISVQYQSIQKVEFIAISSNDANSYPEDSPKKMAELAKKLDWNFPYLYDKTQEIAKKYQAECTPEFYLFNNDNYLIYRGRMDDSSPYNNKQITGSDLKNAIDNFLDNKKISQKQFPSMGCNIKWK